MEEREMTDAEFDQGLQELLGSHFQDLTEMPEQPPEPEGEMAWEWICWALAALAVLALVLR